MSRRSAAAQAVRDLTRRALASNDPVLAGRAVAARAQLRLEGAVAAVDLPEIEGDSGPSAAGRGPVVEARLAHSRYCPRKDDVVPDTVRVARRRGSPVLSRLDGPNQETARRYEALVAARGAVACIDPAGGGGGGFASDGGAAHRWDRDHLLRQCELIIGDTPVLLGRGTQAHADRQRRAITDRALVDAVCIDGHPLDHVLWRHGWSRRQEYRDALRRALCAALGRVRSVIG